MSKIEEIAMKKADKWRDEYLDAWTESEAEIARDAFADGYRMAIADLYPVVKREDVDPKNLYWVWLHGDSEWGISRGFDASDSSILSILGPILSPDQIVMGEDGG